MVDERLGGVEHQLGVGHAEDLEHVVELDLLAAVGDELLERAERVAEAAGGGAGEHADRGVGQLDLLLAGHAVAARPAICSSDGRWKSKRWQRSTIVAGTLCASVVASTNTTCEGGSSSVFRNAFQAAVESMCASSRM